MRGGQTTRVLKLIHLLQGPGRTLQQLRAQLGVTKRTIQRDIAVLEQSGFAVVSESRGRSVCWRLMDDPTSVVPIELTMPERMALYFARGLLRPLAGTPFYEDIESACEKIGTGISAPSHALLRRFDTQVGISSFGSKDYSRSKEVIAALSRAIHHRFTLEIAHATPQHRQPIQREVDPYRFWYAQGALYLIALDRRSEEIRTFAVERIRSARLTRRRFAPPKPETLDTLQQSAFQVIVGELQWVRIWFSAEQAPYIAERTWHPSQKIKYQPDGSLILSLHVASRWEVERWVCGWGKDAEILEPDAHSR